MQPHDPVFQWLGRNIRRVGETSQQVELNRLAAAGADDSKLDLGVGGTPSDVALLPRDS